MSLNPNDESDLASEDELREALRCHQLDADAFAAGVRARIQVAEAKRAHDPLANAPQLLKVAAGLLPMSMSDGNVAASAMPLAHASGFNKLLGYVAMPAISLFVLPAAALFGATKIHSLQRDNMPAKMDQEALQNAFLWANQHKWLRRCLLCGTIGLAWIGATSLMLLLYLISLGVLLYVLSSLAKRGLANRYVISLCCLVGLGALSQLSLFSGVGDQDIHFVDQKLIAVVFLGGTLVFLPFIIGGPLYRVAGWRSKRIARWGQGGPIVAVAVSLSVWIMSPFLWPATPERIKSHVESFHEARFSHVSWQHWEIVARWAITSNLDPDLAGARRLLAEEIAGAQNPLILGSALQVGLVRADQIGHLRKYEEERHDLLDDPHHIMETRPILSLEQTDWVIRASVLRNELSRRDRDYLEKRLHATLMDLAESPYDVLAEALRATLLLEVIQRPIDPAKYRQRVHDWLRKFHYSKVGIYQVAGGFRQYFKVPVGDVVATANAVQLMEIYGIPDGLDLNWVRSFLRPRASWTEDKWISAVTLERLNRVPGVTQPTWLEIVHYERSFIMAVLLVALCLYATLSCPSAGRSLGGGGSASGAPTA